MDTLQLVYKEDDARVYNFYRYDDIYGRYKTRENATSDSLFATTFRGHSIFLTTWTSWPEEAGFDSKKMQQKFHQNNARTILPWSFFKGSDNIDILTLVLAGIIIIL